MKVEIMDNTKKKKIIKELNDNYGIKDIKGLFIKTGKEKIRLFSGNISWDELNELAKNIHVDLVGMQLCTIVDDGIRINFDAINLPVVKDQINQNIVEISDEQIEKWMNGKDIEYDEDKLNKINKTFLVIKQGNDFLGIGKNKKTYIQNYVPKERRA
ncbi:MAG TPA: hypothetical protein P5277_00060 [Candidatus Paceibacterota bacterium]|nr:hypothetical protein [Candidatus Paceibacterota bacterium]